MIVPLLSVVSARRVDDGHAVRHVSREDAATVLCGRRLVVAPVADSIAPILYPRACKRCTQALIAFTVHDLSQPHP